MDNKTNNQNDKIEFFNANNVEKGLGEFTAHWTC